MLALDETGHMMGDSMLDTFAEWERENTRDRLMDGKFKKARKGEIPGGGTHPMAFPGPLTSTANRLGWCQTSTWRPCG